MSKFIHFVVLLLVCSDGLYAGSSDTVKSSEKPSIEKSRYKKVKAVKNNSSLTITFYDGTKEIGHWPFYDSDGGRWDKRKFTITGMASVYNDKGNLIGKGLYVNSMKQGRWLEYSESGKLHGEYIYTKDGRNGPYREYYKTGKVAEEGVFLDGTEYYFKKGHFKQFYPSGKPIMECEGYINGGEGSVEEVGCKHYSENEKSDDPVTPDFTP